MSKTKKERNKIKAIKIKNKELVNKYPFLMPRNRWTDKVPNDYDYSYTELDDMPIGWRKAFGTQLCEDLKRQMRMEKISIYDYRITEIKEKFGELRWYDNGHTREMSDIINKYEHISRNTCICCGKINVPMFDDGWLSPYCEDCFREQLVARRKSYINFSCKDKTQEERDELLQEAMERDITQYIVKEQILTKDISYKVFSKNEETTRTLDCSDVLIKIGYDPSNLPTIEMVKKQLGECEEEKNNGNTE